MISVGPCPQLAEHGGRDQLPDRPRHGHLLLRAPARRRHGGRLLRAPRDPARARGHPLDRAGQALADRDALHRGRLRPAARAGLRADARPARCRGRRDALRHQRPAVADLRRQPDPRRERGRRALDRLRRLDQGRPGRRSRRRRVDDARPLRDRRRTTATSPASTTHQKRREHTRLRTTESFIKTYGIIHPAEQYESDRDQRLAPMHDVPAEAGRGVLRDRRLGAARSGTSPTPASSRSTATP